MVGAKAIKAIQAECERFTSQYEFCRWLLGRSASLAKRWDGALRDAGDRVFAAIEEGNLDRIRSESRAAEQYLHGLGEEAKTYCVYCIGHGHIDMNWMWSWPETVSVTIDTVATVLRLLDEFPTFVFSQSQASVYRILEEYRPDLLETIKKFVSAGRWEVTANHWVETDKNLVSGESLARHMLYAHSYVSQLFGLHPEDIPIDWSPDTFGHAHTVPDYLAHGSARFVYLHRPGSDGGPLKPDLFRWRGAGGGEVIVHNDMYYGYNGAIGPHIVTKVLRERVEATGLPYSLFVYGVGDHGGGPTRADLAKVLEMRRWPLFPAIEFSSARAYFERVQSDSAHLPVVDKELNFEFTGCYTTQTLIKRGNRYGEQRLLAAEFSATVASRLSRMLYPKGMFEEQWRNHLFNHFHDILPGSGVHDTRSYAHGLYQKIVAAAGATETQALRAIAESVDTRNSKASVDDVFTSEDGTETTNRFCRVMGAGAGHGSADGAPSHYTYSRSDREQALVVFNSLPEDRVDVVETVIWDQGNQWSVNDAGELSPGDALGSDAGLPEQFAVEAPDGDIEYAQVLDGGRYWGHGYRKIAFRVSVPGFGFARYLVRPVGADSLIEQRRIPSTKAHTRKSMQARSMHIGIRHVCSYASHERSPEGLENEHFRVEVDPVSGGIRSLVDKHRDRLVIDEPSPRPLLSFGIERARAMSAWQINHLQRVEHPELISLRRVDDGEHVASIVAEYRIRQSQIALTYRIVQSDPVLYLSVDGTWFERGGAQIGTPVLRLVVPTEMRNARPSYEIPFGAISRDTKNGEEVPALSWAAISDGSVGLSLLNDSKHGYSYLDGTLSLTLIRSSYHPDPLPEIGKHSVRCGILLFDGDAADSKFLWQRAARFNRPLVPVNTDMHEGELGPCGWFLRLNSEKVELSGIKYAEKVDGIVVRLFNPTSTPTNAEIEVSEALGRVTAAHFVDFDERPISGGTVSLDRGRIHLQLRPREIRTVLVSF